MKKIKFEMAMFRPIKGEDYSRIYESDNATCVYIALRILARSGVELTTSPYQLYKALTENEPTRRELSNIVDGLKILDEEGVITILNDEENKGRKNTYTIDAQGIELDGSKTYYFSVPIEYIYKIMDEKSKPFALLHYYIFLCSTINAIKHIGEHSQENILEHFPFLKLSLRTLQRRHKRLAELKVICFSESKSAIGADGNFVNVHKSYCMPGYEHLLGDNQKKKIAKGVKESVKALKEAKKQAKQQEKNTAPKKSENPFGNRNPFGNESENPFGNSEDLKSDKSKEAELEAIMSSETKTIKKSIGRR